jgi:hypothetical protein
LKLGQNFAAVTVVESDAGMIEVGLQGQSKVLF